VSVRVLGPSLNILYCTIPVPVVSLFVVSDLPTKVSEYVLENDDSVDSEPT
jgi:hypothetical protein